jgi:hypothetical protein
MKGVNRCSPVWNTNQRINHLANKSLTGRALPLTFAPPPAQCAQLDTGFHCKDGINEDAWVCSYVNVASARILLERR